MVGLRACSLAKGPFVVGVLFNFFRAFVQGDRFRFRLVWVQAGALLRCGASWFEVCGLSRMLVCLRYL